MRNHFRFQLCLVTLLLFVIVGCKVKRPDDVIPESQMENLLYDYHIAKAMGANLPFDENYKKALYLETVFKKYGTTEAAFDSSMVWYTRNTELLAKMYERINKRLKKQQDEINHLVAIRGKQLQTSEPGDSIDVWAWQRVLRLTEAPMNNSFAFVIPSDSNFKDRDTLVWRVRYHFLNSAPKATGNAVMAMQIVYKNDSIVNLTERITKSGTKQIRLFADTLGAIKEVKGFIYYSNKSQQPGTLLADHIALTRYHCTDSLSATARDSINKAINLKTDSLKKLAPKSMDDTLKKIDINTIQERLSPEELNRRRIGTGPVKRPEQIQVEQHIQQEKVEQRRQRQINQRRSQQQRRPN